jgi:hypothetical protein
MRQTNEKVYRCDYCNRAIISAGSMKLHERMCKKNPKNMHKCFQYCSNLSKDYIQTFDEEIGGMCNTGEVTFFCDAKEIEMYSYKLERFKSKSERMKGLTRMPLECDKYSCMEGHDFE